MTKFFHKSLIPLLFLTLITLVSASKQFVGYFQSWSERWGAAGADLGLASLPKYVTTTIISFMQPDATYVAGSLILAGTGVEFSSDGPVVKEAIEIAQARGAKVLISVGGATYTNWAALNVQAIVDFVNDFGLDGVDIDYEPAGGAICTVTDGEVSCTSDQEYQNIVQQIRAALPCSLTISIAGWSIGAYGEGEFASAQPQGDRTGFSINLLKSSAGSSIDQINIMAYDAGPTFDPTEAFRAYRSYFENPIALGVEVPPESWGGHELTIPELEGLADFVNDFGKCHDGIMLWSLQKEGDPSPTQIGQTVCNKFGLEECDLPIDTSMVVGVLP